MKSELPNILLSLLPAIQDLCRQHQVRQLWVFGSVLRPDFRPESDIDFLYTWDRERISDSKYLSNLFDLIDNLENLLHHKVDLLPYDGIRNPYFKAEIDETKVLLYEQKSEKVSV